MSFSQSSPHAQSGDLIVQIIPPRDAKFSNDELNSDGGNNLMVDFLAGSADGLEWIKYLFCRNIQNEVD